MCVMRGGIKMAKLMLKKGDVINLKSYEGWEESSKELVTVDLDLCTNIPSIKDFSKVIFENVESGKVFAEIERISDDTWKLTYVLEEHKEEIVKYLEDTLGNKIEY